MLIKCYRGGRLTRKLPRNSRTKTNSRTVRGLAGRKKQTSSKKDKKHKSTHGDYAQAKKTTVAAPAKAKVVKG